MVDNELLGVIENMWLILSFLGFYLVCHWYFCRADSGYWNNIVCLIGLVVLTLQFAFVDSCHDLSRSYYINSEYHFS